MTINGANFNTVNANAVMGAGAAQNNKSAGNVLASVLGTGRCDKLDLSRFGQKYIAADEAERSYMEKMIRDANEWSGCSNYEIAEESYWKMKEMIKDEINRSESDIKGVEKYEKERKYYQDILDKSCGDKIYVGEDKYGWIAAAGIKIREGGYVSRSEMTEAMSRAESRAYDKYIGRYTEDVDLEDYKKSLPEEEYEEEIQRLSAEMGVSPEELQGSDLGNWSNILNRKFEKYAGAFESVTNESVHHRSSDGKDSLFSREGLTLDNFIEKTEERISDLRDTEKSLKKSMDKYIAGLKPQDMDKSRNKFDIRLELLLHKTSLESEMLDQFAKNAESDAADEAL
ncbi:MAG: hypothetical protein J1F11_03570 [Oscillospiraceae bacterium]|nr:hypothetical protein [Oscillospiraceae bacterium]